MHTICTSILVVHITNPTRTYLILKHSIIYRRRRIAYIGILYKDKTRTHIASATAALEANELSALSRAAHASTHAQNQNQNQNKKTASIALACLSVSDDPVQEQKPAAAMHVPAPFARIKLVVIKPPQPRAPSSTNIT
jgi:hypothetical protein